MNRPTGRQINADSLPAIGGRKDSARVLYEDDMAEIYRMAR